MPIKREVESSDSDQVSRGKSQPGKSTNFPIGYAATRSRRRSLLVVAFLLATTITVGIIWLGGNFVYNLGKEAGTATGFRDGFSEGVKSEVDSRLRVPQTEAEPLSAVNLDSVLRSLSRANDDRSTEALGDAIDETHRAVIDELARIYGLTPEERAAAFQEYERRRDQEVAAYLEGLTKIQSSRVSSASDELLEMKTYEAASDFSVVLADRSCQMFSFLMSYSSVPTTQKHVLKGLCGLLAYDLLMPLTTELRERALVVDLESSRLLLKEHLRSAIAELAVAEDRLGSTYSRTFNRTMFEDTWFEFDSTATLKIDANGVIKAGFDLREYFDLTMDHSSKLLIVTLPEPRVLSRDIDLRVLEDEDGFFIGITPEKRTQALAAIRNELEQRAVQDGLLEDAKSKAERLVQIIYSPFSYLPEGSYRVEVRFREGINLIPPPLN